MSNHHFICYSSIEAADFAVKLADTLNSFSPPIRVWLDKRNIIPGEDWDEQIIEALKICDSVLFIMTPDSTNPKSVCKQEWTRGLKYKKPIVPLLFDRCAEMPFRLDPRQYIDFTINFETALEILRLHLMNLTSPEGRLKTLKYQLEDAFRDLHHESHPQLQKRIQDDIEYLQTQIEEKQRLLDDPEGTARQTATSIKAGIERERMPDKPQKGVIKSKFINPPPAVPPMYFQNRYIETKLIGNFLVEDAKRLLTIVGRGGIGKTAIICRVLKALENGLLPDNEGSLFVDGIVYLSAVGSRRVNFPNLFADLCSLLPNEVSEELKNLYRNPRASIELKMQSLLTAFPSGCFVVLLDNFEDVINSETRNIQDKDLDEALRALLNLPHHGVKVIITTRLAPRELSLMQPGRQARLDLDEGLESPFAENILRAMDVDGKVGLKNASEKSLKEAQRRTRGYPRAIEALFAILSADRDTSLEDILEASGNLLPDQVVTVLVGEAFSRLDINSQQVMQALSIYARPVTVAAVDYLLHPYFPSINSAPVLSRLVNMQFVRKESGRFYLHPVDREYALGRIHKGCQTDTKINDETPLFTQHELFVRGANYFKETRLPRNEWKSIIDLEPQLSEIDLLCDGGQYNLAADVLELINFNYLWYWGEFQLSVNLSERIIEKVVDSQYKMNILTTVSSSYAFLGQTQKAITRLKQALIISLEKKSRSEESRILTSLGNRYHELGQNTQAIQYHEKSLIIDREIGSKNSEIVSLFNLGNRYAELGQTQLALDYIEQAETIISINNIDDNYIMAGGLIYKGEVLVDTGKYNVAKNLFNEAILIAKNINNAQYLCEAQTEITEIYLYLNDLIAACISAEGAHKCNVPQSMPQILLLLGIIKLRKGDEIASQEAFERSMIYAEQLLNHDSQNAKILYTKALVLCGLALLKNNSEYVFDSLEMIKLAKSISIDAGILNRVHRKFDLLARSDKDKMLAQVNQELS